MQGWGSDLMRDCLRQQPFCVDRQPGWATFSVLFIHFRWDGGESISPDCPWDVAQNKAVGLWSPPPRGISQLTSNNVNYPLLWSERHWNFNYVNSEPFCSKSADCFSIEGNVVPVWNLRTLNCKVWDVKRRVNSILAWATWGWLISQEKRGRYLQHPVSPGILLRSFWQLACLAMSAIAEGVSNGWLWVGKHLQLQDLWGLNCYQTETTSNTSNRCLKEIGNVSC